MKRILPILFLCLGMATMYTVSADAGACHKGGCKGSSCSQGKASKCKITKLKKMTKMLYWHKDALEITDDQMDQIKSVKHTAIKTLIKLRADKDIVKVDLKSEMWEDMIDVDRVNDLIDQKYAIKTSASKVYVKAIADILKILNEDQRKMVKKIAKHKKMGKSCGTSSCCGKCGSGGAGKVCPITGKPLDGKGSMKGSMK